VAGHRREQLVAMGGQHLAAAELAEIGQDRVRQGRRIGISERRRHAADREHGRTEDRDRKAQAIERLGEDRIVILISTVLPGTIRREILPVINERVKLCYNPFFIAMGTTVRDFLDPEFVLFGMRDPEAAEKARALYATLHHRPVYEASIENAELIKVAYNTYITMKIGFANTLMEICHKIEGCDVDQVSGGLALGTQRLLGPAYLRGGMGDGGACHPRDNIALSWLARELDLSYDWFEGIMLARERQTEWLAELVEEHHERRGFPHRRVGVYGRAFKAGTNLTVGSPALLLRTLLEERGFQVEMYDPHIDDGLCPFDEPAVYVVATRHDEFGDPDWPFPSGSVIIDPWRFVPKREGIEVIHVGVGRDSAADLADDLRQLVAQESHPAPDQPVADRI